MRVHLLAALVLLAACASDEGDSPDTTGLPGPPITVAVPSTTTSTTTTVAVTTGAVQTVATTTVTVPTTPPVTCGPDPDETHPPPCD